MVVVVGGGDEVVVCGQVEHWVCGGGRGRGKGGRRGIIDLMAPFALARCRDDRRVSLMVARVYGSRFSFSGLEAKIGGAGPKMEVCFLGGGAGGACAGAGRVGR